MKITKFLFFITIIFCSIFYLMCLKIGYSAQELAPVNGKVVDAQNNKSEAKAPNLEYIDIASLTAQDKFLSPELLQSVMDKMMQKEEELKAREKALYFEKKKIEGMKEEIEYKVEELSNIYKRIDEASLSAETQKQEEEALLKEKLEKEKLAKEKQKKEELLKLVKVYSSIKEKKAAQILNDMDIEIAAEILSLMKSAKATKILTYVDSEQAAKICEILTKKNLSNANVL